MAARKSKDQAPPSARLTDDEVMMLMRNDRHPLNMARKEFSGGAARLMQQVAQQRGIGSIEIRRMEFEITEKIIAAWEHGRSQRETQSELGESGSTSTTVGTSTSGRS